MGNVLHISVLTLSQKMCVLTKTHVESADLLVTVTLDELIANNIVRVPDLTHSHRCLQFHKVMFKIKQC